MSLTFYYAPMSTATTVHWTLEELGIPYEAVRVNLQDAADKKRKLGPVNPNLKVPVLVHDGTAIFESVAIQIYLGETFGVDKGLYPAPGPERGTAMKWLVWANVSLGEAVSRWRRNTSDDVEAELRNAAVGKQARAEIDTLLGMLDRELGDGPYILGDAISVVDFHLGSFMLWLQFIGIDLKPFPKVATWAERCGKRPANQKLMAAAA
jgi:glutathione S-transferase